MRKNTQMFFVILVIFSIISSSIVFFTIDAHAQELTIGATRVDSDGDGVPDSEDNCPDDINRDQQDTDGDGVGDVCDTRDTRPESPREKPDLIIESLTHSPANPDTNEIITFKAVVKNIGFVESNKSTLEFRIGGETPGPENRFDVPALAPGKTFTETRQSSFSDAKNYGNTAIADIFDDVDELDEDNNKKTDSYSVSVAPEERPDADNDEIPDSYDNCPDDSNRDQKDSDEDGIGDACDVEESADDEVSSRSIEKIEREDEAEGEFELRPKVPTWVKTTAQFWVEGNVEDQDFTGGIGFLIKERIIDLKDSPQEESSTDEEIPSEPSVPVWIRETTKWWIDGQVPEDQFLEGIKWLVSKKIISVGQKVDTSPDGDLEWQPDEPSKGLSKAAGTHEPIAEEGGPVNDPNKYIGVWRSGNYDHYLWLQDTWDGFIDKGTDLANDGFHLIDMERSLKDGQNRYNGVWKKDTGANLLVAGTPWDEFLEDGSDKANEGYRLIDVERYVKNNQGHYNGVWVSGDDANFVVSGKTWNNFKDEVTDNTQEDLRLIDLESYVSGDQQKFFGVYRSGTYDYGIQSPMGWKGFVDGWKLFSDTDRRLVDIERFDDDGIKYAGLYAEGTDAYALWYAADREEFVSKWKEYSDKDLRLVDLEVFPNQCNIDCLNKVIKDDGEKWTAWGHPKTNLHCEGVPATCNFDASTSDIEYSSPVDEIGDKTYVKLSVINEGDQIFTLPFEDKDVNLSGTWIYSSGGYHHAEDYSLSPSASFEVHAAAPGKVIFAGWTDWGGNAVIISHDANGKTDQYRTIYKHLKNGSDNDCTMSLTQSLPDLSKQDDIDKFQAYLSYTDCDNPGDTPMELYWGTPDQTLEVSAGQDVDRGQLLGWAGNTGPGGMMKSIKIDAINTTSKNIHLHIYFAKRDLNDDKWYLIDPYGIYSQRDCYPTDLDDPINTPCSRYQVFWKDGIAKYP